MKPAALALALKANSLPTWEGPDPVMNQAVAPISRNSTAASTSCGSMG
jgi:hypothetical protein